ncbi:MAG TPA: molybdenum cofactor biosynthesis protein MoaE [Candidatus Acidoferrales bacterium]|nr:molybdenum cofactor biosynthesis protein MoaE [Candidatus Acidoferrales bacterium]
MSLFAIVREPIDPRALEESVRTDACGGVATFLGVVRERACDGRSVTGLSYEAHEGMAVAEFAAIAREIEAQHAAVRLGIVHRVGPLGVGEIAVAVCAAAPHRGDAFDACRYAIDQLKARAPIWKKEHYADGTGDWVENECRSI